MLSSPPFFIDRTHLAFRIGGGGWGRWFELLVGGRTVSQQRAIYSERERSGRLPFDYDQVQQELRFEFDRMERSEKDAHTLAKRIEQIYVRMDPERTIELLCGIGDTLCTSWGLAVEKIVVATRKK